MTTEIIDIADLDCIFLTYDEPKKEEFWIKISNFNFNDLIYIKF